VAARAAPVPTARTSPAPSITSAGTDASRRSRPWSVTNAATTNNAGSPAIRPTVSSRCRNCRAINKGSTTTTITAYPTH
jgi:hypothetical protein